MYVSEIHGIVTGGRRKRSFNYVEFRMSVYRSLYSLQHSPCYRTSSSYQQAGEYLTRIMNSNTYICHENIKRKGPEAYYCGSPKVGVVNAGL
jgi:hypothetical protein